MEIPMPPENQKIPTGRTRFFQSRENPGKKKTGKKKARKKRNGMIPDWNTATEQMQQNQRLVQIRKNNG